MKPTYEELEKRVAEQDRQLAEQNKLIKQLLERIAHLEDQLNKNSKNSSKPPSSDQKSNIPRKVKKEIRPFHPGASRQLAEESLVTLQTNRYIDICPKCHSPMTPTGEVIKWQQVELPEIRPLVHQTFSTPVELTYLPVL